MLQLLDFPLVFGTWNPREAHLSVAQDHSRSLLVSSKHSGCCTFLATWSLKIQKNWATKKGPWLVVGYMSRMENYPLTCRWELFYKIYKPLNNSIMESTRWFKVAFLSPSWRSLNLPKGSLNHPQNGHKELPGKRIFSWLTYDFPENSYGMEALEKYIDPGFKHCYFGWDLSLNFRGVNISYYHIPWVVPPPSIFASHHQDNFSFGTPAFSSIVGGQDSSLWFRVTDHSPSLERSLWQNCQVSTNLPEVCKNIFLPFY